jgi:hypothetical protein
MDCPGQGRHRGLMATRQSPSSANAEGAPKVIAATRTSVPQSFAQRLQWRRRVAIELDHLLDVWKYPDPSEIYAAAPSREAALDE